MVDIRKIYFLVIFIRTCFSYGLHCIPCSEEYKHESCGDTLINDVLTEWGMISIREGRTDVKCIPCDMAFSELNLFISCSESDANVQTRKSIQFPDKNSIYCDTYNRFVHEGQCRTLFEQSYCAEEEWLIRRNNKLICETRRCSAGQLIFGNRCTDINDMCSSIQFSKVKANDDGTAECTCINDYVKDPLSGVCHELRSQGPCKAGWVIEQLVDSLSVCIPDICYRSYKGDFLYYDESLNRMSCAQKGYDGYCVRDKRRLFAQQTVQCIREPQIRGSREAPKGGSSEAPIGALFVDMEQPLTNFHSVMSSADSLDYDCYLDDHALPDGSCKKSDDFISRP